MSKYNAVIETVLLFDNAVKASRTTNIEDTKTGYSFAFNVMMPANDANSTAKLSKREIVGFTQGNDILSMPAEGDKSTNTNEVTMSDAALRNLQEINQIRNSDAGDAPDLWFEEIQHSDWFPE